MNTINLSLLSFFLVMLVATFHETDAGCPSKEWVEYNEEKCVRVLDSLDNHLSAELTCQEQNSTLLSITSIEEQKFLNNILFSDLGTVDNIWLGAARINSTTTFRWTDGSAWTFDSWKEGSPSNTEGNDCVQMVSQGGRKDNLNFDPTPSGLWSDVPCEKRNLVVCQKRPNFSLDELTTLFFQHQERSEAEHKELEKKLDDADKEFKQVELKLAETEKQLEEANLKILQVTQNVKDMERNPVPLGFVYIQLSGQPDPSVIWPTVGWTQVTQDYAGLFFRAEGGNSSTFGQLQNDQSPRLSRVEMHETMDEIWWPRDVSVPERGASEFIYISAAPLYHAEWAGAYRNFLSFHTSVGEVRPKNQAIRLWKRTT